MRTLVEILSSRSFPFSHLLLVDCIAVTKSFLMRFFAILGSELLSFIIFSTLETYTTATAHGAIALDVVLKGKLDLLYVGKTIM